MSNMVPVIVLPVADVAFPAVAPQEKTALQDVMRELATEAAPSELELVKRELAILCSRFDGEVG